MYCGCAQLKLRFFSTGCHVSRKVNKLGDKRQLPVTDRARLPSDIALRVNAIFFLRFHCLLQILLRLSLRAVVSPRVRYQVNPPSTQDSGTISLADGLRYVGREVCISLSKAPDALPV